MAKHDNMVDMIYHKLAFVNNRIMKLHPDDKEMRVWMRTNHEIMEILGVRDSCDCLECRQEKRERAALTNMWKD